jgi:hypothetical protein
VQAYKDTDRQGCGGVVSGNAKARDTVGFENGIDGVHPASRFQRYRAEVDAGAREVGEEKSTAIAHTSGLE